MEHMRPSILRRPLLSTDCTKETSEEQYRREQEAIAARGRRMIATETRLMGSLYPTTELQQQRQAELDQVRQEQLAAQAEDRRREAELLSAFTDSRPATAPAPARPWEGASMSYSTRCEQDQARKQFEAQVAEENKRMALAKSLERQQQKQAEAAEMRQQLQEPASGAFWNLGAVPGTGRFIAPEQRWMSGAAAVGYRPMLSRPGSTPASPRTAAAAAAPWATTASAAAAAAAASAAPVRFYGGLRAPYATSLASPSAASSSSAAAAAAGVKASGVQPPWATYTPAAATAPAAAAAAAATPGSPGSLSKSSSSNSSRGTGASAAASGYTGRGAYNSSSAMASLLGGGVDSAPLAQQQKRPATAAAAGADAGERRYPWEWPGA